MFFSLAGYGLLSSGWAGCGWPDNGQRSTEQMSCLHTSAMDVLFLWLMVLLLVFFCFWKRQQRPKHFPPGPSGLPFLGNLLQFNPKTLLKDLDELAKKYGSVFSIYIGGTPVIFIHGFPAAKEVLVIKGIEFAGRTSFPITDIINKGKGILALKYGEVWKEQRRFVMTAFRNFGLGRKSMEEKIREEGINLVQAFTGNLSVASDPFNFIDIAVSNIISTILFGKRFGNDNSAFRTVLELIQQNIKMAAGFWALLYNGIPLIRDLPLPHQTIKRNTKKIFTFLEQELEEHKATRIPREPRDFIDAYLEEILKAEGKGSSFEEDQLLVVMHDLLAAGSETTSKTLQWGLLYLVSFPEIQEQCQMEMDSILGSNAILKYEDRNKLPYTNATIHEIQRISSVAAIRLGHAPIQDVQLFGYEIPKDTLVFVNIRSVLRDESQWKFPHEFNPSNFLNERGEFVKPEAFLPFSAGPRVCLGEHLAVREFFIFFTNILRTFQLLWPEDSQAPDLTPNMGITQFPSPFKVLMKCRQQSE